MDTLLLRLVAPMQSWGVQSQFGVRDSGLEPSKSGVIGILCAAMGIPRSDDASLAQLSALRLGVRVDRQGQMSRDYHTASHVLRASGGIKDTELSSRYYLADAAFLVGLEADEPNLLLKLQDALLSPVWALYLGRKAFVPGLPVALKDGLCLGCGLVEALSKYPFLGRGNPPKKIRVIIEDPNGDFVRPDQPISFAFRRFAPRRARTFFIPPPPTPQEAV